MVRLMLPTQSLAVAQYLQAQLAQSDDLSKKKKRRRDLTTSISIYVKLLVLTIQSAHVRVGQDGPINAIMNSCLSQCIQPIVLASSVEIQEKVVVSWVENRLSPALELQAAFIRYSHKYWSENIANKCFDELHSNLSPLYAGQPSICVSIAEVICSHMDRLVSHSGEPSKEKLSDSLQCLWKLVDANEAVMSVLHRYVHPITFVATEKDVEKLALFWFISIENSDSEPILEEGFLEVELVRKVFFSSFCKRLANLTGDSRYEKLATEGHLHQLSSETIQFILAENEYSSSVSKVGALLRLLQKVPARYFTSYECQIIQTILYILDRAYHKKEDKAHLLVSEYARSNMIRFQRARPDNLVIHLSPKVLEWYISSASTNGRETFRIIEFSILKLGQKLQGTLMKEATMKPLDYLQKVCKYMKKCIKSSNWVQLLVFWKSIGYFLTKHLEANSAIIISETSKLAQKCADALNDVTSDLYLPILEELIRYYSFASSGMIKQIVDSQPKLHAISGSSGILLKWSKYIASDFVSMSKLYSSILHAAVVADDFTSLRDIVLNLCRDSPEYFEAFITYHLERLDQHGILSGLEILLANAQNQPQRTVLKTYWPQFMSSFSEIMLLSDHVATLETVIRIVTFFVNESVYSPLI